MTRTELKKYIADTVNRKPPENALRFLFDLDLFIYRLTAKTGRKLNNGIHPKHKYTEYREFFVRRVSKDEHVLDVGCGAGIVAKALAKHAGAKVTGIDLNVRSIATAKKEHAHLRVTYLVQDATRLLPDGKFDVVVLSNVLEHLKNRPAFLRRLQKKARPSRMLIRVPMFDRDWRIPLKKDVGAEWRLDSSHEIEYTVESFREEMSKANLVILEMIVKWGEIWAVVSKHKP